MAGWFEAFAQLANAGAQGLDRYQVLRKLDTETKQKIAQQAFENQLALTKSHDEQAVNARQVDLLNATLLGKQRDLFTSVNDPGTELTPDALAQAKSLGMGGLVHEGTQFNPMQQLSAASLMPQVPQYKFLAGGDGQATPQRVDNLPGADPTPMIGMTPQFKLPDQPNSTNLFMGTPDQRDAAEERSIRLQAAMLPMRQNELLQQLIHQPGGLNPNNPNQMAALNVASGGKINRADIAAPQPTGGGVTGWLANLPPDKQQAGLAMLHQVAQAQHIPAAGDGNKKSGLTPAAIQLGARQLIQTGVMPTFGMGAKEDREAIMNAAAEVAPEADWGTAKGVYAADVKSLGGLTKTADVLRGFKNAAGKNLDLFSATVKPLADAGSQFLNAPLRDLEKKATTDTSVTNMLAARQVALREIARVTTNPNLTGVLSDEARQEVQNLIPASATIGQIYGVVNILRQDMDNVEQGLNGQIAEVTKRISDYKGKPGGRPVTAATTTPSTATTTWQFGPDGKLVQVTK